jgi:hypothetical protein
MTKWHGVVAVAVCALSCSAEDPGEVSASRAEPIVGGERSGAEQDGVVLLRAVVDGRGETLCSASLVAPNLIMTARHCVSYTTEGAFFCSVRGELLENPTGGGRIGLHVPAASLEVYGGGTPRKLPLARGLRVLSTLSPTACDNDLAFVVLDTSLDLPVVPMRIGEPAQLHELVVLVGFGITDNQQFIPYETQPRLQKRGLEVTGVGPDSIDDGVTTVPPRVLLLEGPSGCIGDSGGPLLAESSGAVLGVYSLLHGGSCSAPAVRHNFVHVPPFRALIDEAFAASGGEPLLEPEPTSEMGEAGSGGAASGAPNGASGEGSTSSGATGALGGAAGETAREPEPKPKPAKSSGCSLSLPPAGAANALLSACLLTVGVVARRGRRRRGRLRASLRAALRKVASRS